MHAYERLATSHGLIAQCILTRYFGVTRRGSRQLAENPAGEMAPEDRQDDLVASMPAQGHVELAVAIGLGCQEVP